MTIAGEDALAKLDFHGEVLRYLRAVQREFNLSNRDMRTLDWGCGAGLSVLYLLEQGYDAYGVEIVPALVEKARETLTRNGYDGSQRIFLIDENGGGGSGVPFPDNFFHYTWSEEVFEHVADRYFLSIPQELFRTTTPGGVSFHAFPPHMGIVETHLLMPFVHWLPKNEARRLYIRLCTELGMGPKNPSTRGKSKEEIAEFQYRYSCNQTFYRHYNQVRAAFRQAGFDADFVSLDHSGFERFPFLQPLLRHPAIQPVANWLLLHFITVDLLARKPQ